jgi:hypothetical protein
VKHPRHTGPTRADSGRDLHLDVVPGAAGVGRSLEAALREAVRSGRLAAGSLMPGSRNLAADLGLSRARWTPLLSGDPCITGLRVLWGRVGEAVGQLAKVLGEFWW